MLVLGFSHGAFLVGLWATLVIPAPEGRGDARSAGPDETVVIGPAAPHARDLGWIGHIRCPPFAGAMTPPICNVSKLG